MEILREHVKYVLDCVSGGLAMGQRETREGAAYFVFKDGKVTTFNDEVYCSMPLDLGFEGAVKGEQLLSIVSKMKGEMLSIKFEGAEAKITSNRRRAGFQIDMSKMEALEAIQPVTNWVECPTMVPAAIGDCCGCAVDKKNDDKFYKSCLHITPTFIEATDSLQFMRCQMQAPVEKSTLVKAYTVRKIEGLDISEWGSNQDWVGFRTSDGLEYYARTYGDDYPALDQLAVKQEGDAFIPPQGFIEAIEAAKIFCDELDNPLVKVILKPNGQMLIEGKGVTGWFQEMLEAAYDGPRLEFFANPKVLKQFAEAYTDGKISETALSVYQDDFVYLSSIQR